MASYKILITGSNGQVGRATLDQLGHDEVFKPIALNHTELDITRPDHLDAFIQNNAVAALVNCAAYTAVDKAESDAEPCWAVNASGPRILAQACNRHNIPFIHLSTDYVYHNNLRRPLKETDDCKPKNVYGASKLAGEQKSKFHHPKTIILRTSWVYAQKGSNFLNTIIDLAKTKSELTIVNDQIGAPTWATDLAKVIRQILSKVLANPNNPEWYGIYNCTNRGAISWFDFATYFVNYLGLQCHIRPMSSSEFKRPAPRPAYSVLDLSKIEDTFKPGLRDWNDAVKECLDLMG